MANKRIVKAKPLKPAKKPAIKRTNIDKKELSFKSQAESKPILTQKIEIKQPKVKEQKEPLLYSYTPQLPPEKKSGKRLVLFFIVMIILAVIFIAILTQFPEDSKIAKNISDISITIVNSSNSTLDFAKRMSIDSISSNVILLRNNGSVTINPEDFSLYVNGTKEVCASWTLPLNPHSIRNCRLSYPCLKGMEIRLVSPGNTTQAICP